MNKRKIYLEALRVIACFFVIFNHTEGCGLFYHTGNSWRTWLYLGISYIVRTAVPIFFMISGACLLGKNETLSKLYSKRVLRIVIVLFVGCLVHYCLNSPVGVNDFFVKFCTSEIVASYWYLWAYLGTLVMLPFLRAMIKGLTSKEYIYLLVCHFIFSSMIPIITKLLEMKVNIFPGNFAIPIIQLNGIFYVLIGYYIDNVFDIKKINGQKLGWGGIIALILIIYECLNRFEAGVPVSGYVMIFDYLLAIYIFVLIKVIFNKIKLKEWMIKVVTVGGSLTFGIYLLDLTIKPYIWPYVQCILRESSLYIISIVYSLISMFVGGLITYLAKVLWARIKLHNVTQRKNA